MYEMIFNVIGVLRFHIKLLFNKKRVSFYGAKQYLGKSARIITGQNGQIKIGKSFYLSERSSINAYDNGIITIGNNNFFSSNCNVACCNRITIGSNNLFAQNIVIVDHNHKYENMNQLICEQGFDCKPVSIGSDCWICANVVICPGATIKDHIVVAANAVVSGELSVPGVYAGIPAKLIKLRVSN